MNPVPTIHQHALYRSSMCVHALCTSDVDVESMEEDGVQIIPVSPEISAAYLCKDCFIDLPIEDVVKITRNCLSTEKGLFRKHLLLWKKGATKSDPYEHLEASVRFLRGQLEHPPFPSTTYVLHDRRILGHPRIIHRRHLALISFD